MRISLLESVMYRSIPKGDVKEANIVWIVANSLYKQNDGHDAIVDRRLDFFHAPDAGRK